MILPQDPQPTCGVVIEKNGDNEKKCPNVAADQVTIVDPETRSRVSAILLVCEKHSKDLDDGKMLIFMAEDQNGQPTGERISVQYSKEEINDDAKHAPNGETE